MIFRTTTLVFAAAAGLGLWALPAQALTTQECSAKYQAAKTANTLKGATWNQFRKAECGDASAAAPANPIKTAAPATASPSAANAVFPKAIDPKYAKEKPSAQIMKTCLDQYKVNKTGTGNGDLKWIMKGGGYYSECNKKLKGA